MNLAYFTIYINIQHSLNAAIFTFIIRLFPKNNKLITKAVAALVILIYKFAKGKVPHPPEEPMKKVMQLI